jgi:hypothetical protein
MPDITVLDTGSIILFRTENDDVRDWLLAMVSSEATWLGYSLAVEPRYAGPLIQGLTDAGFTVAPAP